MREWLERASNQYDRMRFAEYLSKVYRGVEHHKLASEGMRARFVVRHAEAVPKGETRVRITLISGSPPLEELRMTRPS